jgi:hypothetical protein
MRISRRAALALLLLVGCATPPPLPPAHKAPSQPDLGAPRSSSGRIVIGCEPDSARVMVDGDPRGSVAEIATAGGLELPRGLHRIEIAAEGYRTFRLELNLGEKPETIQVKLLRSDTKP